MRIEGLDILLYLSFGKGLVFVQLEYGNGWGLSLTLGHVVVSEAFEEHGMRLLGRSGR